MNQKIKVGLNRYPLDSKYSLGMSHIFGSIANSDNFDVYFHDDEVKVFRGGQGTIVHVNNKRIYFDFWEYTAPTYSMEIVDANFDLIIKLQHKNISHGTLLKYCGRKNLLAGLTEEHKIKFHNKIIPFTFFPDRAMERYVGNEKEIESLGQETFGFFCGKGWKCRHIITDKLKKDGIECNYSDQAGLAGKLITDEELLKKMRSSKFGIVLAGRSTRLTDSKNRREIDYMMMKKPILMNYKPFYYNELVDGKHFIYMDENTDLKALDAMYNIEEIAMNGYEWYLKNATPNGIANLFKQILIEKNIL